MSTTQPMPSPRRRPIPGMASQPEPTSIDPAEAPVDVRVDVRSDVRAPAPDPRRANDYSSTRLVNFRIPADLHDRFRALLREAEDRHPRLRKQSLTELVIALLEEGPQTADEVADLIRRKRLAEHEDRS